MIDLISRPNRHGAGAAPEPRTVNDLIQARIDRRISRRGLIRRAAALGIAAPVVGVMLHATSDYAFGKPRPAVRAARQAGQTVTADKATAPSGTPREGGTLTAGSNEEPDTLNPYLSQLVAGYDVVTGVMDGLLRYDSTQQLLPSLAEGFEISADGLTYTFKLRQGVSFQNEDAFGSQDVIDTWKMIMNPDFGAWDQLGWDKITDITSPDPTTIVMTTGETYAPFISFVGGGNSSVISPSRELAKGAEAFKQEFGRTTMVGTGPLRFIEWRTKEQIVLEKNPTYWGEPVKLDKVIIRILPDDNTQIVQLRTGEIQMAAGSSYIGALRVDEVLQIPELTVLEHSVPAWSHLDLKQMDFLRMTKVRQALDFATPSKDIIEKLLKGRADPSVADQQPGTWAFNPNIQPRPYDPDQARVLLAEAGLTQGSDGIWEGKVPTTDPQVGDGEVKKLEIELWGLSGDTQTQQVIQVIAQSWNAIGVKAMPMFQDISTIWGPEGYQFTDKMTACLYSWFNANDPDDMFYWHSSQIPTTPTGTGGNILAYFHKFSFQDQIDQLTAAGAAETDQTKRQVIYFQIQELLHEEVPVIFIYWGKAFPTVASNVGGFWPSAYNRMLWNVQEWYLTE